MAAVALNFDKEAVSLEGEGFRRIRKLQICQKTDWYSQIAVKSYIAGGRLGTYKHTHKQTTVIIPRAHAPSVNQTFLLFGVIRNSRT